MPLTFISVLWPSASTSSFMFGIPLNNDFFFRDRFRALSGFFIPPSIALPPTTTTLSTTTTSSHQSGSIFLNFFLHNLNFDDTYDYDEYELEENYVDYEDDEDIGPLQPDDQTDEDESEKQVDTSTENTTLERVSQNITAQSDQTEHLAASYWIYDYDQQNETHFPNYPNDLTYNDTYWDNLQTDGEYNQTDWEGNHTNWEDTTPQNLSDWGEENNQTAGTKSQLNYTQFRQDHDKVNGQRLNTSQSGFDAIQISKASSNDHRVSVVWQGAGFGVTQGAGTIMRQGQGSSVRQGAGTSVRQGTGFSVTQSAGTNVRQNQGFAVSQGAGEAVHQGVEFGVSQGPGSNVRQDQGFVVNQGAREAVSQEQANDTFVNKSQVKSKMGGITGRTQVKEKTKVSKCCPLKQGYDVKKKRCIDVSDSFNPLVWNGFYFETVNVSQEFRFRIGKVICHHQNEEFMQATNISRVLYVRWVSFSILQLLLAINVIIIVLTIFQKVIRSGCF